MARNTSASTRSALSTRSGTVIAEKRSSSGAFRSPDMPRAFWISAFFFPLGKCELITFYLWGLGLVLDLGNRLTVEDEVKLDQDQQLLNLRLTVSMSNQDQQD